MQVLVFSVCLQGDIQHSGSGAISVRRRILSLPRHERADVCSTNPARYLVLHDLSDALRLCNHRPGTRHTTHNNLQLQLNSNLPKPHPQHSLLATLAAADRMLCCVIVVEAVIVWLSL